MKKKEQKRKKVGSKGSEKARIEEEESKNEF